MHAKIEGMLAKDVAMMKTSIRKAAINCSVISTVVCAGLSAGMWIGVGSLTRHPVIDTIA